MDLFGRHKRQVLRLVGAFCAGVIGALLALFFADFVQAPSFFLHAKSKTNWSPLSGLVANADLASLPSRNASRFESGNMGPVQRISPYKIKMSLRSDNDDALPKFWRQWWYVSLDKVETKKPTTILLSGAGQWNKYIPVYSYDNQHWQHFKQSEISRPEALTMKIKKQFTAKKVWLARFPPYTYSDMEAYGKKIGKSRYVTIASLGASADGHDMPLWTITNRSVSEKKKSRVVIHARTHPGELASSYMLEGMINFLLSNSREAAQLRNKLIFEVVPMLNPDGVIAGNNRVTTYGVNLEGKWYTKAANPLLLDLKRVPHEVRLFYRKVRNFIEDRAPVTMALNLHSSAGEPNDGVFFFPHFGPKKLGYAPKEASLYDKQIRFIDAFMSYHGKYWFNPPAKDGTRAFTKKSVPESWWWRNFEDKVMALSIETTYGMAGNCGHWMKPDDLKTLGVSLAKAIGSYHHAGVFRKTPNICK